MSRRTDRAFYRVTAALLAAIVGGAGAAAALEREQFVAGWPLELPAAAGVFDVELTRELYEHVESIEQIAVLDAEGRPMSFYRWQPPAPAPRERRMELPASPLHAAAPGAPGSVSVVTDRNGTSVAVTPGGEPASAVTGFLLDARALDWAPAGIELDWARLDLPFLLDVTIEHSTDLQRWRRVAQGAVAALDVDGEESRHARLPLAGAPAGGYYRVVAGREVPEWRLAAAALIRADAERPALETATLAPLAERPAGADDAARYFDAGGPLPVERVAIGFAGRNGWARAAIASSGSLEGPWTMRVPRTLFYVLDYEGRRFASDAADIGLAEDRYWRVTFAGAPAQEVELELGYTQSFARFAAEGTPPYWLVAGTKAEEAGPDPTFRAVWDALPAEGRRAARATLGQRVELGGAAALAEPPPWRTIALWGALAAGVLVVGTMAWRLGRDLGVPRRDG